MSQKEFPGYWRCLWMFWMQPLLLHQVLLDHEIDPSASLIKLWRHRATKNIWVQVWLKRNGFLVMVPFPLVSVLLLLLRIFDNDFDIGAALGYLSFGMAFGVAAGVATGLAVRVATGVAFGVAAGVAAGVASGVASGVAVGVASGVASGVTGGMAFGVAGGVARGVAGGMTGGVTVGVASGLTIGVLEGVPAGVAVGMIFIFSYMRLWCYPSTAIRQLVANLRPHWMKPPILDYDLLYFPIPFLKTGTLSLADKNPSLAQEVLEACIRSPGCRTAAREIREQLQVKELTALTRDDWQQAAELRGTWLAGRQHTPPALLGFGDCARFVLAAQHTHNAYQKYEKLNQAKENLANHQTFLSSNPGGQNLLLLNETLPVWERAIDQLLEANRAAREHSLPNPFRASQPLKPGESDQLFRGRTEAIRQIEDIIGDAQQRASLVVLAPRRTGKTSLLRMLTLKLPDAVIVFFDLQDHPSHSPAAFYRNLIQAVIDEASRQRVGLPELPAALESEPIACFGQWLKQVDEKSPKRILICIDEFERLAKLFPGDPQELLQLMGLIRATIQHRDKLRLLVAGATPLEDLDSLWNDHLINLRELRLEYLSRDEVVGLLKKPIPEFPETCLGPLANRVYDQTGGQPYLVQLFGNMMVDHLNRQERRTATESDLEEIFERMVLEAGSFFRDTIPSSYRPGLYAFLQQGQPMEPGAHSFMRKRSILNSKHELEIPLTLRWLEREA